MTGTQFIGAHCPWHWSGWILATSIDAAFVMSLHLDATLARYRISSGHWPAVFRLLTGAFSVFVNIGDAALHRDLVGTVIHLLAPALLLVLGEAGPAWQLQLANLPRVRTPTSTPHTSPVTHPRTTHPRHAPRQPARQPMPRKHDHGSSRADSTA